MVLLEVVDGGEGTRVFKGRRRSAPGEEGGVDQEVSCSRCQEEEERRIRCQEQEEEERSSGEGSGWLATPNGCRLLAQVKIFLKSDNKSIFHKMKKR